MTLEELVNLIERVRRNADPPRHIREGFLTLVISEVLAVEVAENAKAARQG